MFKIRRTLSTLFNGVSLQDGELAFLKDKGGTLSLYVGKDGQKVCLNNHVISINGSTGEVTIDKTTVGLDQVNNTSDLDKPISTAVATELTNYFRLTDGEFVLDLGTF